MKLNLIKNSIYSNKARKTLVVWKSKNVLIKKKKKWYGQRKIGQRKILLNIYVIQNCKRTAKFLMFRSGPFEFALNLLKKRSEQVLHAFKN